MENKLEHSGKEEMGALGLFLMRFCSDFPFPLSQFAVVQDFKAKGSQTTHSIAHIYHRKPTPVSKSSGL